MNALMTLGQVVGGGMGIVQMVVVGIIIIAVIAIGVVAVKAMGLSFPPWVVTIFWIAVIAIVAIFAIKLLIGLF
jgi:hypothetical protein